MADLLRYRAQNLRGWHPDALTRLDYLALRAQFILSLEREEKTARQFADAVREGVARG